MTNTEVSLFKESALDSFALSLEIFNRPHETGRINTTLILFNHSFEMILKAAILKRGGEIRENPDEETIGFSQCVSDALNGQHNHPHIDFIDDQDAVVLRTLNQLRDAAQHEYVDLGEHPLYLYSRQAVELFEEILEDVFNESVSDSLPERVLPLSTRFPVDVLTAINKEYEYVEELLDTGQEDRARARLRAIESLERAINEDEVPPAKEELEQKLEDVGEGEDITRIFPGIVTMNSSPEPDTESKAPTTSVQLGDEGPPVRYATEEEIEDEQDVNLFREVNPHNRYNLDFFKTAESLEDRIERDISWMRVKAVMKELGLLDDPKYYKELSTGNSGTRKAIHPRTLDRLEEALTTGEVDVDEAWETHKSELFGY